MRIILFWLTTLSPSSTRRRASREDGSVNYAIDEWLEQRGDDTIPGVYTVRDASNEVQYVGVALDVASALRRHVRAAGDAAHTVRIVEKNAQPAELEAMRAKVLAAFDRVPRGNQPDSAWETVVSPFADASAPQRRPDLDFTKANVDNVLDDIRPFLVADGGNIDVVAVNPDDRSVTVRLQGACGTCPSAAITMKNGVEQALRARWPDLGRVVRFDDAALTADAADRLLDPIRPAVTKLGATVSVLSANLLGPGVVELDFEGPENVKFGIELTLTASPLVSNVRWSGATNTTSSAVPSLFS